MNWLETMTGKKIDLLNPDPELVANIKKQYADHFIMAEAF